MHKTGQSVIVRHKEFVCDVIAGTGTPTSYNIARTIYMNPGLSTSFPWLSSIAQQFQEYTWRGVVFHFVSTSGASVASTNTALGTVMMHSDYRVTAPSPTSKAELLNEYFASDAKPSESFVHPIECDPRENPYNVQYVRTGAVPSGEDPKTYDLCKTHIVTQGMPAASTNVGELWVTYEVELRKPQITSYLGMSDHIIGSGSINTTNLFGTVVSYAANSTIGGSVAGKTYTFPVGTMGYFFLELVHQGSAMDVNPGSMTLVNCSSNDIFRSVGYVSLGAVTGFNLYPYGFFVYIPDPAKVATVTFGHSTLTNASTADLYVTRLSNMS